MLACSEAITIGRSVDKFVDYDDFIWINGDPRDDDVSNYDVNEPGRPWDKVRPEFMALIEKTFGPQE